MTFSMRLPGRVTTSFAMAGMVMWGGLLPATLTLRHGMSGSTTLTLALIFSAFGLVVGLMHGLVLGYAGRPPDMSGRAALLDERNAFLVLPFGLALALFGAMCVPLSMALLTDSNVPAFLPVTVGWLVLAGILVWTGVEAMQALRNAYERWPESRVGTLLIVLILGTLLFWFSQSPPRLWGSAATFTPLGSFILATALAIWVAAPSLIVLLHLVHTRVLRQGPATRW